MRSELFDYDLPPERIAQIPIEPRNASRLLVLRESGSLEHLRFDDFPSLLSQDDLLVFNDTRVMPARLEGRKSTGARVEMLLIQQLERGLWEVLAFPGRRLGIGSRVSFGNGELNAEIQQIGEGGTRIVRFETEADTNPDTVLHHIGTVPLPPYIHSPLLNADRYQTVYARAEGSAAAPTAGLHFTPAVFDVLKGRGVGTAFVSLHIGIATFRPIKAEDIEQHEMHAEWYTLPEETAGAIRECRGRVIAVGTTTVRCLESAASSQGVDKAGLRSSSGRTRLYVTPGYRFGVVDALLTNFHMPRSSLLVLVSALAGRERVLEAYRNALESGYRFLSFGDAMFIERPASGVGETRSTGET